MPEQVELIIKTAGDGMPADYRSMILEPYQQIILRFISGDSVVITGERFSPEEYKKHFGEAERHQILSAINRPKENSSNELVRYAKKSGLFSKSELKRFTKLDEIRQVIILTNTIINHEFDTGEICARPFPKDMESYYADCFRDCC